MLLVNYTFKCNAYYIVSTMPFVHFRAKHFCPCETPLCGVVAISRKGYLLSSPRKILLYLRGEKAQTSKRVSIIACNNVISKEQCAPWWQELSASCQGHTSRHRRIAFADRQKHRIIAFQGVPSGRFSRRFAPQNDIVSCPK